jgi:hypothetical protein
VTKKTFFCVTDGWKAVYRGKQRSPIYPFHSSVWFSSHLQHSTKGCQSCEEKHKTCKSCITHRLTQREQSLPVDRNRRRLQRDSLTILNDSMWCMCIDRQLLSVLLFHAFAHASMYILIFLNLGKSEEEYLHRDYTGILPINSLSTLLVNTTR